MYRRIICAAACALATIGAPPMAQASGVTYDNDVCTVHAKWQLTIDFLGSSYADVTITDGSCTGFHVAADPANLSEEAHPTGGTEQPYTFRVPLSTPVGGAAAYAAYAMSDTGPVVVAVVGDQLTAAAVGSPSTSLGRLPAVVAWLPAGGCGTGCFLTTGVGVDQIVTAS